MDMKEKHQAWGCCGGGGFPHTRTMKEERALFDDDIRLTLKKMEKLVALYPYTKGIVREGLDCLAASWVRGSKEWLEQMLEKGMPQSEFDTRMEGVREQFSIQRKLPWYFK